MTDLTASGPLLGPSGARAVRVAGHVARRAAQPATSGRGRRRAGPRAAGPGSGCCSARQRRGSGRAGTGGSHERRQVSHAPVPLASRRSFLGAPARLENLPVGCRGDSGAAPTRARSLALPFWIHATVRMMTDTVATTSPRARGCCGGGHDSGDGQRQGVGGFDYFCLESGV